MEYRYRGIVGIKKGIDIGDREYMEIEGRGKGRPELKAMIERLEEGDIVKIKGIGTIARDVSDFLMIYEKIRQKGAEIEIEGTADVMGALIEYNKRAKRIGRPSKQSEDEELFGKCYEKWVTKEMGYREFMEIFGYNKKDALYKAIKRYEEVKGIDRKSMRG